MVNNLREKHKRISEDYQFFDLNLSKLLPLLQVLENLGFITRNKLVIISEIMPKNIVIKDEFPVLVYNRLVDLINHH